MPVLHLIRTGQSVWETQGRAESLAAPGLTDEGVRQMRQAAEQLANEQIRAVHCGAGDSETQSARTLAAALHAQVHVNEGLHELDLGLWQGLADDELRARHGKLYLQWLADPSTVRPPGGEIIDEAASRLRDALGRIVRRTRARAVLVVLRPLALAVARWLSQGGNPADIWQQTRTAPTWYTYPPLEQSWIAAPRAQSRRRPEK